VCPQQPDPQLSRLRVRSSITVNRMTKFCPLHGRGDRAGWESGAAGLRLGSIAWPQDKTERTVSPQRQDVVRAGRGNRAVLANYLGPSKIMWSDHERIGLLSPDAKHQVFASAVGFYGLH
jgi:hypothetical protein